MILVFLGSWRSTLVVMVSTPLSILTSIAVLATLGQTINTMTLGGKHCLDDVPVAGFGSGPRRCDRAVRRRASPQVGDRLRRAPPLARGRESALTHFGISTKYLSIVADEGYVPSKHQDLSALRSVLSAGAPVAPHQFDWLYEAVKRDMIFASISGGTEIIGCFMLGSPIHPVRRGELTCKGLGLAVNVMDDRNAPIIGVQGDLVCTEPFPSMPLTFWGERGWGVISRNLFLAAA
jgi:hypothetical protein